MPDPTADIVDRLAAQSVGTAGTDLFEGPERGPATGIPANCVFVMPTGGPAPLRMFGGVREIREPTVQIIVRNATFQAGKDKARDAWTALESATPSGYLDVMMLESEPFYIGVDQAGRHKFSLNALATYGAT